MTNNTIEDVYDYREEVRIDPCECNHECGNYILSIKGEHVHMDNAPPDEFIDVCTLPPLAIVDLCRNCDEILDLLAFRDRLEESTKKHP